MSVCASDGDNGIIISPDVSRSSLLIAVASCLSIAINVEARTRHETDRRGEPEGVLEPMHERLMPVSTCRVDRLGAHESP